MLEIFDSHAHYDDSRFDSDREALLGEILPAAGVVGILTQGTDPVTNLATIRLTEEFDYIYGAVGVHPENALNLPQDWLGDLRRQLQGHKKLVAVGEIGLDYHWLDACPKERQQEVFAAQLDLAFKLDYPVVIHDREAHGDILRFLRRYRPKGVLHCYSGSWEMAREALDMGLYLGLGGVVTFKNSKHAVEVAQKMPLDRMLLETDAPYLAPVPYRGRRNDSSMIPVIIDRIAEIRGEEPEVIAAAAAENARLLFAIPR